MKQTILARIALLSLLCSLPSLALAASASDTATPAAEAQSAKTQAPQDAKTYGEGLTLQESTPISSIYAHPDRYVDKEVRVEGRIVGVCKKRGCWMELAGDQDFQSLKVKVEDGVIVFPADSKGRYGTAQGVLKKIELSLEQTRKMAQHECEENKKAFDPESVTEAAVIYQIQATGAVIDDRPAPARNADKEARPETPSLKGAAERE